MTIKHREIPVLPIRKRVAPLTGHINRSYSVGKRNFMRACLGEEVALSITTTAPLPPFIKANLLTNINLDENKGDWIVHSFDNSKEHLLTIKIKPQNTGVYWFKAEFSLDNGENWLSDSVPDSYIIIDPPQVDRLLMYTIIPTISGSIAEWTKDLARIKRMGFNAIHLLPITTLDHSESPYAAKDFFSVDPWYTNKNSSKNGLEQLEEFVQEAIDLGLHLCFDLVLNHVGVHSSICQKAPDWIVPDPYQADGFQRAKFLCDQGWMTWDDLALINFEHPSEITRNEIWNYMKEYALFWANYANETNGFVRFDNLHSSNIKFLKYLTKELHREYPNVGILAEYFTDEDTLLQKIPAWGLNLILATPWDYKFVPQLRNYLSFIHRMGKQVRYFMPVTSHDSGTPAQEFNSFHATVPRYVAAVLLGTGASGMVQGVEYGEMKKINFIGKHEKKRFPDQAVFENLITKVNVIFQEYKTFSTGGNCTFIDNNNEAIIAALRTSQNSDEPSFIIICNFDIYHRRNISFDLNMISKPNTSYSYHELLSGSIESFNGNQIEIEMEPCSAKILKLIEN